MDTLYPLNTDPRPKNRKELAERFRKVKPVVLGSGVVQDQHSTQSPSSRTKEVTSGLEPYSGEWTENQVIHLLRRTLFGVKMEELHAFSALSLKQAVDLLVTVSPVPGPPVNDYHYPPDGAVDPTVPAGQSWIEAAFAGDKEGLRITSLKNWFIRNMLTQQTTIHEKMTFFWHSLLATQSWDIYFAKSSYRYLVTLREHALGNYKALIKAITIDPSMLIFLNGNSNKKEAPDENYARELQELFCVGKGPGSKYTEGDVQMAARVLTGWVYNWQTYSNPGPVQSSFKPERHDVTDKGFSSFYNNKVIVGKSGADGASELDELLDMIFNTDEMPRYICRRLYTFFVYPEITSSAEQNVIEPLAVIFRNNNFEIAPTLKTLLKSAHFFDAAHSGAIIKSPLDHMIGLWRTMGVTNPYAGDLYKNSKFLSGLLWNMASMGLEIGDPPNVAGWAAYYQVPQLDKSWITTDTITKRAQINDSFLYWGLWGDPLSKADLISFVKQVSNPADPNILLTESVQLLLGIGISDEVLASLKNILLSGQQNDIYWTTAWIDHTYNPGNEVNRAIVTTRLQQMFQRLLQLGEFTLM